MFFLLKSVFSTLFTAPLSFTECVFRTAHARRSLCAIVVGGGTTSLTVDKPHARTLLYGSNEKTGAAD